MSQQFTDRFGRTVVMTGTPGGRVEFLVVDPEPNTGTLKVVYPEKGPSWATARHRIEGMQPSWWVEPAPLEEESGDEPA